MKVLAEGTLCLDQLKTFNNLLPINYPFNLYSDRLIA